MWLARNGEEPAEENEVFERGFELTVAVAGYAAAVGQRERYVRFGIVQGFLPFLMLWLGTASDETIDHIFEKLVIFTCVGIFIVSASFFLSCFVFAVFCIDERSIAFGHHCLVLAYVLLHSISFSFASQVLHGSIST